MKKWDASADELKGSHVSNLNQRIALLQKENTDLKEEVAKLRQVMNSRLPAILDQEKKMAATMSRLEEIRSDMDHTCYSLGHELRTPLRNAESFINITIESIGRSDYSELSTFLAMAAESVRGARDMVNDLMELSRAGTSPVNKKEVDLAVVIAEVKRSLTNAIANRKVVWNIQPMPIVWTDYHAIRDVIFELLNNALRFTKDCQEALIQITTASRQDGHVIVCVQDNGVGFDPAFRNKLFTPFGRLHPKDDFPGNGIGLARVRRIISSLQAEVWADAGPNKGASFYVALPLREPPC